MRPLTPEQEAAARDALARRCADLGLVLAKDGRTVIAPLARPVAVDASALDPDQFVAGLMYLAFKAGKRVGASEAREAVRDALGLEVSTHD